MSRLTAHRNYCNWVPAVTMNLLILGFTGFCQANETKEYESYFGDEITSAKCDGKCIEEWGLKRTYICQLAMNDMQYRQVPDDCEI